MMAGFISFILRILLIATIWGFIWRFVKPNNQLIRILRATLLVLCLLGILAVVRMTN